MTEMDPGEAPLRASGVAESIKPDVLEKVRGMVTTPSMSTPKPPAGTVFQQSHARINQQIIVDNLNITLQRIQNLDDGVVGPTIHEKLQTHIQQAGRAVGQEQPDYADGRRHADAARRIADGCARLVWDQFNQVSARLAGQQSPQASPEQPQMESQFETAKKLLIAGAALALIVADLTTTGGMITLASLSYGAGHTLALQRRTALCSTCGAAVAIG